ncbi:unnamed protein product [Phaeothamnion confervicola]
MSSELLRNAALHGKAEALLELLAAGANPCGADVFGLTALHYAVWNGHIRCVEILCANSLGRDKNGELKSALHLVSRKGWTPLHLAAAESIEGARCVPILVAFGAALDAIDFEERTPLNHAMQAGRSDCVAALNRAQEEKEARDKV